jgi:hypothetical protein
VSTPISSYAYQNDAIGRRTARIDQSSASFQLAITNAFDYNIRSEVIEAIMGTNTYNYAYDPIGNRRHASKTTDLGPQTTDYIANELNQYTSVSNAVALAPTYDADGNITFLEDGHKY